MTTLREVYNEHVLINPEVQKEYNTITNRTIELVVDGIKSNDGLLFDLYSNIYFTGSRWDGLQVGTNRQECDVNICFDVQKQSQATLKFCEDIGSPARPNFAYICLEDEPTHALEDICDEDRELGWIVSPVLLFQKMWIAGEAYLESVGNVLNIEVDDDIYSFKVETKISSTPWTLTLENENFTKIEIDIVPAINVHADMMPRKLKQKIKWITKSIESSNMDLDDQGVLAISLKTDSYRFEVDCHELERKLLFKKGQAKTVVKLIKYLRNVRKGPLEKMTSHMIKTVVMYKILAVGDDDYWNNLEKPFEECTELLVEFIKRRQISDVIFKSFNILTNKIKDETYLDNMDIALRNISCLLQDGDIDILFAIGVCSFCNQCFTNPDGDCDEKALKRHLAEEHDIRTWCNGGATCTCTKDPNEMEVCVRALGECNPEDREKDYHCTLCDKIFACHDRLVQHVRNVHKERAMLRNALCPHCHRRIMTKCGLCNHIWIKHPEFREAAEMTLNDKGHEKLVASLKETFEQVPDR